MQDVYKNIADYNPNRKSKIIMVLDDMITDMINNNKLNPVVTVIFIKGRKMNVSSIFIT